MPRNVSGTYSLPAGNPVVTGTTVASSWANTTLDDLKVEVTDSLSRSGKGGMLAPLALLDGALGAPSLTFANELSTGLYRAAAGDLRLAVGGVDRVRLGPSAGTINIFRSPQVATGVQGDFLFALTTTPTAFRTIWMVADDSATVGMRLTSLTGQVVLRGTAPGFQSTDTANSTLNLLGNRAAADAGTDVTVGSAVTRTNANGLILDVQNNAASLFKVAVSGTLGVTQAVGGLYQVGTNLSLNLQGNRAVGDAGADVVIASSVNRAAGSVLSVQNVGLELLRVQPDATLALGAALGSGASVSVTAANTNGGLMLKGNRSAADAGADVTVASIAARTAGNLFAVQDSVGNKALLVPAATFEAVALNTWHRLRQAADFSTTSSTFQNVTGASFPVTANADYEVTAYLYLTRASATTSVLLTLSGPAGATSVVFCLEGPSSATGLSSAVTTAFGFSLTALSGNPGPADYVVVLRAVLRMGATAGTVQLALASSDNATSVSVKRGSTVDWRRTDGLE